MSKKNTVTQDELSLLIKQDINNPYINEDIINMVLNARDKRVEKLLLEGKEVETSYSISKLNKRKVNQVMTDKTETVIIKSNIRSRFKDEAIECLINNKEDNL